MGFPAGDTQSFFPFLLGFIIAQVSKKKEKALVPSVSEVTHKCKKSKYFNGCQHSDRKHKVGSSSKPPPLRGGVIIPQDYDKFSKLLLSNCNHCTTRYCDPCSNKKVRTMPPKMQPFVFHTPDVVTLSIKTKSLLRC